MDHLKNDRMQCYYLLHKLDQCWSAHASRNLLVTKMASVRLIQIGQSEAYNSFWMTTWSDTDPMLMYENGWSASNFRNGNHCLWYELEVNTETVLIHRKDLKPQQIFLQVYFNCAIMLYSRIFFTCAANGQHFGGRKPTRARGKLSKAQGETDKSTKNWVNPRAKRGRAQGKPRKSRGKLTRAQGKLS